MREDDDARLTYDQLESRLASASVALTRLHWRHKSSGDFYTLRGVGLREANCEAEVEYSPQARPAITWHRPLEEFLAKFKPL